MSKVSVMIPSRHDSLDPKSFFLPQTVQGLFDNASGEIEVIVVLDGYWPVNSDNVFLLHDNPGLKIIHRTKPLGMRAAINSAAAIARGEYLLKCDDHCLFDQGYDEKLKTDCEADWVSVPRRYSLDPENWARREKRPIDHMFLCYPNDPNDFGGPSLKGKEWRSKPLQDDAVFDLMSAQGSCWFMHRDYFHFLELMDEEHYGQFSNEFQEIGLKCWLSGGRVVRNTKTWYAHLHKGRKYGRGWHLQRSVLDTGAAYTNRWMDGRLWHKQTEDIRWLVRHFWPVPTWPEESVGFVFHRRKGGSGQIRGLQMAQYFKARLDPEEFSYKDDVHIYVKFQPPEDFPEHSYLDVLDEPRRIPWLLEHPNIGVIASSETGCEYLKEKLGRDDVHLIPQHHVNIERITKTVSEIKVAGVVGGEGAIQCDVEELIERLKAIGVEFRWLKHYRNPQEIVEFYKGLDLQIVWRMEDRPLKNPLKIINAMSFGIPTIAYPEVAYREIEGHYLPAEALDGLDRIISDLRENCNSDILIAKAEEYHIENISKLYKELL